jgi:hypothetical protein
LRLCRFVRCALCEVRASQRDVARDGKGLRGVGRRRRLEHGLTTAVRALCRGVPRGPRNPHESLELMGLPRSASSGMADAKGWSMRRKKPMKAPFVVTVSAAAVAVAFVAGCNGLVEGDPNENGNQSPSTPPVWNPPRPEPPRPTTNPPPPEQPCPAAEPQDGALCMGWVSQCTYKDRCETRPSDSSPARTYRCSGGQWNRTSPSYIAGCPAVMPRAGDSCATCGDHLPAQCNYLEGSGCPPAIAACDPSTLTWSVAISSCNPPPPDAGIDP